MSDLKLTIPNFIQASSPNGLRRLMLLTNARVGGLLQFFDIGSYRDDKGKLVFIAWYYEPVKSDKDLEPNKNQGEVV